MTKDYTKIDSIVNENIERLRKKLSTHYCGIKTDIDRAILQALLKNSFRALYDHISYLPLSSNEGITVTKESVILNNAGVIKPSLKRILFHYIYLLGSSLFITLEILKSLLQPSLNRGEKKFSFVDINLNSTSPLKDQEEGFIEFCHSNKIPLLNQSDDLYFVSTNKEYSKDNFYFKRKRLLLAPIQEGLLKKSELLALLVKVKMVLIRNLFWSLRFPKLAIVSHHIGWLAIIEFLNAKSLINNYFVTNTYLLFQPIWFNELPYGQKRNYRSHILFYSTNNKGLRPLNQSLPKEPFPYFDFIKCDEAWVWNEGDKKWIEDYTNIKRVNIVGSILFYTKSDESLSSSKEKRVGVFDVPVFNDNFLKTVTHENLYMYNSEEAVLTFLQDILEACDETGHKMCLKVKRGIKSEFHSEKYISFVEKLKKSSVHEVHSENINLYDFISHSDAVITLPFTSPYFVAEESGKPATFYDPTKRADERPYYEGNVKYNKDELISFLKENA